MLDHLSAFNKRSRLGRLRLSKLALALLALSSHTFAADDVDLFKPVDSPKRNASCQYFSTLPSGMRVYDSPHQSPLDEYTWIKKDNYQLGISDNFKITGLLISKRRYLGDERADIAPIDFVLGWQKMSDPNVLKDVAIRQSNRFYYWRVEEFPLPRHELELYSTNLHLIPDNPEILKELEATERGQILTLEGYLVDVKSEDGFIWSTSRVRDDSGDGACEIMLVKHVTASKN